MEKIKISATLQTLHKAATQRMHRANKALGRLLAQNQSLEQVLLSLRERYSHYTQQFAQQTDFPKSTWQDYQNYLGYLKEEIARYEAQRKETFALRNIERGHIYHEHQKKKAVEQLLKRHQRTLTTSAQNLEQKSQDERGANRRHRTSLNRSIASR